MKIGELYNIMSNPMDEDHIIDDILDVYDTDKVKFYNNLLQMNSKRDKKVTGIRQDIYKNALYVYLFNEWKKGIDYLATNDFFESRYREDAIILQRYLSNKTPSNKEEVIKLLNGQKVVNQRVEKALRNLRFDLFNSFESEYFDSSLIYAKTHSRNSSDHRLYINCDSNVMDLIALEFMRKCKERKLKFNFKFDIKGENDNSFIIYSNTDTLSAYVEILEEIKRDYYLDSHLHTAPLLTSKINNWIGYGSSPYFAEHDTFNGLRVKHIDNCIHNEVGSWIRNNAEAYTIKNEKIMHYYEYLMNKIIDCIKEKSYQDYSKDELDSNEFKLTIINSLYKALPDMLDYFEFGRNFDDLIISYKDDIVCLEAKDLDKIFLSQLELFRNNISDFNKRLRDRIKGTSGMAGISANYAVDSYIAYVFNDNQEATISDEEAKKLRKKFRLI